MSVSLSPIFQLDSAQVDANGAPRSGAKLFTYLAGTSTKTTTYKTSSGSGGASHANPILLDSNGLPPAPIWLTQGLTYKFYLAAAGDTDPPTSPLIPVSDNITGINDIADLVDALAAEWVPSAMAPTYVSGTSFTVTGDQTTTLNVNRRIKLITTSSGTVYATIIKSTYTSLTTLTVVTDSGSLDTGISSLNPLGVQYGIVSSANTSLPFLSRDQQCGRLVYVSATQIRLDPQDGNTIWIYTGAAGWTRRTILTAGITAANTSTYVNGTAGSSLAASTGYYVYLFDNAGVLTMDFSTTAPAVDATTGLKIKTGDATRLLIGMVRTNSSTPGQFQTPGLVLSWYRRRAIAKVGAATSGQTTGSATIVEVESTARIEFLAWAEEGILAQLVGHITHSTTGATTVYITLDGLATVIGSIAITNPVAAYLCNASFGGQYASVTDGFHDIRLGWLTSVATATFTVGRMSLLTQG